MGQERYHRALLSAAVPQVCLPLQDGGGAGENPTVACGLLEKPPSPSVPCDATPPSAHDTQRLPSHGAHLFTLIPEHMIQG